MCGSYDYTQCPVVSHHRTDEKVNSWSFFSPSLAANGNCADAAMYDTYPRPSTPSHKTFMPDARTTHTIISSPYKNFNNFVESVVRMLSFPLQAILTKPHRTIYICFKTIATSSINTAMDHDYFHLSCSRHYCFLWFVKGPLPSSMYNNMCNS